MSSSSDTNERYEIGRFFQAAVKRGASDLIFTAGVPPCLRLNGELSYFDLPPLTAMQAVDRIIDMFPPHQQNQVRAQLSFCLVAILAQRLIPRADGKGRVAAVEMVRNVPAVANLIREGRTSNIAAIVETHAKFGMRTMDASLRALYQKGLIKREMAAAFMMNPDALGSDES